MYEGNPGLVCLYHLYFGIAIDKLSMISQFSEIIAKSSKLSNIESSLDFFLNCSRFSIDLVQDILCDIIITMSVQHSMRAEAMRVEALLNSRAPNMSTAIIVV